MQMTDLGFCVDVPWDFETTLRATVKVLSEVDLGIETIFDIRRSLQAATSTKRRRCFIFAISNMKQRSKNGAHDCEIGLVIPCNVVVYELDEKRSRVLALDPLSSVSMVISKEPKAAATIVRARLAAALFRLVQPVQL